MTPYPLVAMHYEAPFSGFDQPAYTAAWMAIFEPPPAVIAGPAPGAGAEMA